MKLIIGLGNPGSKYKGTRHNIGFITVDELAYQEKLEFDKVLFDAAFTKTMISGEAVIIMKPLTYMNLSGEAVRPLMNYFKIDISDLLVIYDDMDLSVGKIRLRQKGGSGGHNGLKSLISCLGSDRFNRIRIGVGRPRSGKSVTNHVLANFEEDEREDILLAVQESVRAVKNWLEQGDFMKTMNQFN